jgi:hypothetical protein
VNKEDVTIGELNNYLTSSETIKRLSTKAASQTCDISYNRRWPINKKNLNPMYKTSLIIFTVLLLK